MAPAPEREITECAEKPILDTGNDTCEWCHFIGRLKYPQKYSSRSTWLSLPPPFLVKGSILPVEVLLRCKSLLLHDYY